MSEPVPGSVIPSAQTISPRVIPGRYALFCSSFPKRVSQGEDMSVCTSTLKATPPDRHRAISSPSTTLERKSPPAPPYSTGNSSPRNPSSPSRRQNALGIRPASSHSSTRGATSFSTKARTLFRSIACSGVNTPAPYLPPSSLPTLSPEGQGRPRGWGEKLSLDHATIWIVHRSSHRLESVDRKSVV